MKRGLIIITLMLIALAVIASVQAVEDSDGDGIKDVYDRCSNTNPENGMPVVKKNLDYLGCSCTQIDSLSVQSGRCFDFFCVDGRPLEISLRFQTKDQIVCGQDYCIGDDWYEFPDPGFGTCVDGQAQEYCVPKITERHEPCVKGEIPQKKYLKIIPANVTVISPEINISLEKREFSDEKAFDFILDNPSLKQHIGNINRNRFLSDVAKFPEALDFSRIIEDKRVGAAEITIPFVKINITPVSGKELKNILYFVQIKNPEINSSDVIFLHEQPYFNENGLMVWKINNIPARGSVLITYQVNEAVELETDEVIYGRFVSKPLWTDWWPLILIPIIAFLAYQYMVPKKE